jgi:hypothetical protein
MHITGWIINPTGYPCMYISGVGSGLGLTDHLGWFLKEAT